MFSSLISSNYVATGTDSKSGIWLQKCNRSDPSIETSNVGWGLLSPFYIIGRLHSMPVITSWTSNPTQTRRRGWPYLNS